MKYAIEIGKIVEGAFKKDTLKVQAYTEQLVNKLEEDGDSKTANKFKKLLVGNTDVFLSTTSVSTKIAPIDNESRVSLVDIYYPNQTDFEVVLSTLNQTQINDFIAAYNNSDRLKQSGFNQPNSLLLYGVPGTGKTRCAYYIANKLGLPLVIARLDSLISSYLGTTSKNIRQVFDFAQRIPCVLFLDEFDAIAKARDDHNELGELKRVVNSLLQNIDIISKDTVIIAATNHESLLDSAVWRRFEYKIFVDLPDIVQRTRMIPLFLKGISGINPSEIALFAEATQGLSGSQIEEIVNKAVRKAIINDMNLNNKLMFNQLFSYLHVESEFDEEKENYKKKIMFLRKINNKSFSYSIISGIIGISKGYISTLISGEIEDERKELANQNDPEKQ